MDELRSILREAVAAYRREAERQAAVQRSGSPAPPAPTAPRTAAPRAPTQPVAPPATAPGPRTQPGATPRPKPKPQPQPQPQARGPLASLEQRAREIERVAPAAPPPVVPPAPAVRAPVAPAREAVPGPRRQTGGAQVLAAFASPGALLGAVVAAEILDRPLALRPLK